MQGHIQCKNTSIWCAHLHREADFCFFSFGQFLGNLLTLKDEMDHIDTYKCSVAVCGTVVKELYHQTNGRGFDPR